MLLCWQASGFPGLHTPVHQDNIGEAHIFEKLSPSGGIGTGLAGNDQLARTILKPRVTPFFWQLLVRFDWEHAEGNIDTARRQAGGCNIRSITDIYY
jgi:hypothetical protein